MKIKELENAASNFGTPIYVYDLSIIESQNRKLQNAFKNLDNYKIHFAAKSLSNISILKFINNLGIGLDAVSIEEVKIAIKSGFNKDEILYTPNGVSFSEIKEAKSLGVKINLDSLESIKDFSEHYPNHSISVSIWYGIPSPPRVMFALKSLSTDCLIIQPTTLPFTTNTLKSLP